MNILYVDYGNVVADGHMYQYYGDLFRELKQLSRVYFVQSENPNIPSIIDQIDEKIDCVIYGLGYFAQNNPKFFSKSPGLENLSIPVVCMIHKPQNMLQQKLDFCKVNNVDLVVDSQSTYKEYEKYTGIKSIRLPFTATPKYFYPRNVEKKYDIGFSGALHENKARAASGAVNDLNADGPTKDLRPRVREKLKQMNCSVFWNSSNTLNYRIASTEEYATRINQSKVWLATTGPLHDVSPRYFEVILSKTLLLCNDMPDAYEGIFEDEKNCVMFNNDLTNFEEKLRHYLENNEERELLTESAYKDFLNKYTWKHMAENLLKEIKSVTK